jgi:hypothetical protein
MKLELTKQEAQILKKLVEQEREYLGTLNFDATDNELNDLRTIAPLNYKIKELCKD